MYVKVEAYTYTFYIPGELIKSAVLADRKIEMKIG